VPEIVDDWKPPPIWWCVCC